MPDFNATLTAGVYPEGYREGTASTDPWVQYVAIRPDNVVSFKGRTASFRVLGIAGTVGHKLFAMFNAVGSTVVVDLETITFDVSQTAARVVAPPYIRIHKLTAIPTGGTALSKVAVDSALSSSASVTLYQATASDGGAATAIVATLAAGTLLTQEPVSRAMTLVGVDQFDRAEYFSADAPITLRAGEGVVLNLDYALATSSPITDNYTVNARWREYNRP